MSLLRTTLIIQTIYFLITGIWPLLHIHSFMLVTGPKTDIWLVKTVSVLITVIALTWLVAIVKKKIELPIIFLAITSAMGLMVIDLYYSFNDTIRNIYLSDAIIEMIFIILLFIGNLKANMNNDLSVSKDRDVRHHS